VGGNTDHLPAKSKARLIINDGVKDRESNKNLEGWGEGGKEKGMRKSSMTNSANAGERRPGWKKGRRKNRG